LYLERPQHWKTRVWNCASHGLTSTLLFFAFVTWTVQGTNAAQRTLKNMRQIVEFFSCVRKKQLPQLQYSHHRILFVSEVWPILVYVALTDQNRSLCPLKISSNTAKNLTPVLPMEVKQGKSVILFLKMRFWITISIEALDETFSLIRVLIGLSLKVTKLRSCPVSPHLPKTGMGPPKTKITLLWTQSNPSDGIISTTIAFWRISTGGFSSVPVALIGFCGDFGQWPCFAQSRLYGSFGFLTSNLNAR